MVEVMGGATMGTEGDMYPHLRKVTGTGGQENLKAHTRTAVLDDSIQACNAVCMMQCSFPALNDSVLHINSLGYVRYVGFVLLSFCGELPGA